MPGDENESGAHDLAAVDQPELTEVDEMLDADIVEFDVVERTPRDPLSIAIVVGLAALFLVCVIFIFIANGNRPAGT